MGWWHWIIAVSDETHDRLTPPDVFQLAYGVKARELAEVLSPITETVVIGPPEMSAGRGDRQYGRYTDGGKEQYRSHSRQAPTRFSR